MKYFEQILISEVSNMLFLPFAIMNILLPAILIIYIPWYIFLAIKSHQLFGCFIDVFILHRYSLYRTYTEEQENLLKLKYLSRSILSILILVLIVFMFLGI